MDIRLHRNARTTPAIRAVIQQSPLSVSQLSKQLNLTVSTVYKWKKRGVGNVQDASSRPHNMLNRFGGMAGGNCGGITQGFNATAR